jgi:hypothetical protein
LPAREDGVGEVSITDGVLRKRTPRGRDNIGRKRRNGKRREKRKRQA